MGLRKLLLKYLFPIIGKENGNKSISYSKGLVSVSPKSKTIKEKKFLENETIIFLQKGTEKGAKRPPNSFTIRPEKLRISTGKQRLQDRQVNRYLK